MKKIPFILFLFILIPFMANADTKPVKTDTGLIYIDVKEGSGPPAKAGNNVKVHYTGWILENGLEKGTKGKKFDSSVDRGRPFIFTLGVGRVIPGWDQGVKGMKVGGKRTLKIPAKLGYGARGAGASIPPNSDLLFEVELIEFK